MPKHVVQEMDIKSLKGLERRLTFAARELRLIVESMLALKMETISPSNTGDLDRATKSIDGFVTAARRAYLEAAEQLDD